jgi:hypothetical protein
MKPADVMVFHLQSFASNAEKRFFDTEVELQEWLAHTQQMQQIALQRTAPGYQVAQGTRYGSYCQPECENLTLLNLEPITNTAS